MVRIIENAYGMLRDKDTKQPVKGHLFMVHYSDYAALEAQLSGLVGLLQEAEFWIGGALTCKEWRWDGDQHDAASDTHKRILSVLEVAPPAPKVTETVWRTDEPPKNGTPIYKRYVGLFRFLPYKPNSQQYKSGKKGRWQEMNEYGGWENCPTPVGDEWCFDIPNTAAQEAGKP